MYLNQVFSWMQLITLAPIPKVRVKSGSYTQTLDLGANQHERVGGVKLKGWKVKGIKRPNKTPMHQLFQISYSLTSLKQGI